MSKPHLACLKDSHFPARTNEVPAITPRGNYPLTRALGKLASSATGVLLVCSALLLTACSGGHDDETTAQDDYPVSTIEQVFVDTSRETPSSGEFPALPSRTLESLVFLPEGAGQFPLLVFSHGLGATPQLYEQLLERLASAGFVIVAPAFPLTNGNAPASPDGGDTQQQPGDVSFLIDSVLAAVANGDAPFAGRVDVERVGTLGHSNGGITTLGVTANSCCRDPRINSAVVLAGNPAPFGGGEYVYQDAPPTMLVHGTADALVPHEGSVRVFNELRNPKAMLTLNDVDHGSFLVPGGLGYETTASSIINFFQAHLLGDTAAAMRLESQEVEESLAELRYAPAGGPNATLPLPPSITNRMVTVEPTTDLSHGQVVTVTWKNFSVGKTINILQCSGGGSQGSEACDFTQAKILQPNPTGEGSLSLEVIVGDVGIGRCDATTDDCVITVNDAALPDPEATINIPISFAP